MIAALLGRLTPFEWLQLAEAFVVSAALLLGWSLRTGFKSGRWLTDKDARTDALDKRIIDLEARFGRAGGEMSDLATDVQALPARVKADCDRDYMRKDISEERWNAIHQKAEGMEARLREIEVEKMTALEVQLKQLAAETRRVTQLRGEHD